MKTTFILPLFLSLVCVIGGSLSAMGSNNPSLSALDQQLLAGAKYGNLEQVQASVRNGANVNVRTTDFWGLTPLFYTTFPNPFGDQSVSEKIADFLLQNKANINAQSSTGDTPLHLAATQGNLPIVRFLLSRGADPQIRNKAGATALDTARSKNHPEVAEFIQNYINSQSSVQPQPSPEAKFGI